MRLYRCVSRHIQQNRVKARPGRIAEQYFGMNPGEIVGFYGNSLRPLADYSMVVTSCTNGAALAAIRVEIYSARTLWTNCTAMDPSPTAEATRFTLPARISPTANTAGRLVSSI